MMNQIEERQEQRDSFETLLGKFPAEYRRAAEALDPGQKRELEEIRVKAGQEILFCGGFGEISSGVVVSARGVAAIVEKLLDHSVYAHMEELCRGFVTVTGGHRVGICGKAVTEEGKIRTIKEVSSLNVRKCREVKGCCEKVRKYIFDNRGGFRNTLIVSPPKCGKTTLLRDIVRTLSERGIRVSLVDERSEVAAVSHGIPQHDVGLRTDVMDGCRKSAGIRLMIRSMAPGVVCTDEIGSPEDAAVLRDAVTAGIGILTTVHGSDIEELRHSKIGGLIEEKVFERYVFLGGVPRVGTVVKILDRDGRRIDL